MNVSEKDFICYKVFENFHLVSNIFKTQVSHCLLQACQIIQNLCGIHEQNAICCFKLKKKK